MSELTRYKNMASIDTTTFLPSDFIWKGLTVTESAAKQILYLLAQDPNVNALHLSVRQSGCAGFSYVMDLVKDPADDDLQFIHKGARLYVPLKAMPFIDGTEVDYVCEGLNQIFKFNNPKAQHACGCGESFGVE